MALHGRHTVSLRARNPQEMFLGGFFKKATKFAKAALPFVSLIPGIGTAVGIGATLAAQLIPGGKKKKDDALTGSADSLSGVDNTAQVADIAKPAPIRGSASFGADFKRGGKLPAKSGNLKDFVVSGKAKRFGNTALEFTGPDHDGGGIQLPGVDAEVEGGETLDLIVNKGGSAKSRGVPFVFSKALKVPGSNVSFANAHKATIKRGGSESDIRDLASKQESIAGVLRDGTRPNEFFLGGLIKGASAFLGKGGLGSKILGVAGQVAPFVPGLVNTIRGATESVESPSIGPIDRSSVASLTAERNRIARTNEEVRFNPNAALNENRRLLASITGNRNVSDAAKAASIAGTQTRAAGIRTDFANRETDINTRIRADKRRNLLGLTQSIAGESGVLNRFDAGADFRNQEERLAAKAAKGNLLTTGLSQIGDIFAQRQVDKLSAESDERMVGLLGIGRNQNVTNRFKPFGFFGGVGSGSSSSSSGVNRSEFLRRTGVGV